MFFDKSPFEIQVQIFEKYEALSTCIFEAKNTQYTTHIYNIPRPWKNKQTGSFHFCAKEHIYKVHGFVIWKFFQYYLQLMN